MGRLLLLLTSLFLAATALAAEPFKRIDSEELHRLMKQQGRVALIDTRSAVEFAEAHIEGAVNIPFVEMEHDTARLRYPKDAFIVFYCTGYS